MAAPLHATLVARHGPGGWRGVLLIGASGCGKSDLALRCLDLGWRLVADDRVIAWRAGGRVFGRAPGVLAGLIEARGQGMVDASALPWAQIVAVARLRPPPERLPEPELRMLAGAPLPHFDVAPLEASAPARLRRIVEALSLAL